MKAIRVLTIVLCLVVSACAQATPKVTETVIPEATATIVETTEPEKTRPINIEILIDSFGHLTGEATFWQYISDSYHKEHPNITVSFGGAPDAWLQLQPRIVAGNPPDLTLMISGAPFHQLASEGKMYPLDEILASPAYGAPDKSFYETVIPGLLDAAKVNGKTYMFPAGVASYGWWYMPSLFEKHGWEKPYNGMSMDELFSVMDKIKAENFDVIPHPGKWSWWAYAVTWYDLIQRYGGVKAWCALDNLEPGSYTSEPVLKATKMMQDIANKYFPKDWTGLDWKLTLNMMAQGNAALYMDHTNFPGEVEDFSPIGSFEFFRTPAIKDGKGDPAVMRIGSDWFFIPANAQHPKEAADLLKYIFSKENAARWVSEMKIANGIQGSIVDGAKLAEENGKPLDLGFISAYKTLGESRLVRYGNFMSYATLEYETIDPGLLAVMSGQMTPEEFLAKVQAEADRIREDPNTMKFPKECPDIDW